MNFYPFETTISKDNVKFKDAIENIDIGGPAMVRAAAKNFENCCVLTDPKDYDNFINNFDPELSSNEYLNKEMALKAFEIVAHYDICIANYLGKEIGKETFEKYYSLQKINDLRYGENPHQSATLYSESKNERTSIVNSKQHQVKRI